MRADVASMVWRRGAAAWFLAAATALAACSGGGAGGSALPSRGTPVAVSTPAAASNLTQASLEVVWPAQAVGSAARPSAAASGPIASLTIAVDNGKPVTENAPVPTGSAQTVTYAIGMAPGDHTLAIVEYNASMGVLGRAAEPVTIVQDGTNVIGFTLDGDLAQIAIVAKTNAFLEGTLASGYTLVGDQAQTFTALPEDAAGNRIIDPGAIPVITATSAQPAAIVAANHASDSFTLYAPAPAAAVAITAAGKNRSGAPVTATFNVGALAAFYVANFTTQTLGVYDENGTALALPAIAFYGLQNPSGLAYVPSKTRGKAGTLVVTQTADSSMPSIVKYDTAGNAISLPQTAFAGTSEPLFPSYGVVGSTPTLAVPNEDGNSVQLFDTSGNALPLAAGAFPNLDRPVQIVYDPHDADYYVTNLGSGTINKYSTAGAAIGAGVTAGYSTQGETFDPNDDELYVAYQQQPVVEPPVDGKPATLGPALAHVMAFDETPAAVSQSLTAFLPPSATAFYASIAFDPATKQLYVTDAGDDKIVAFSESGATVTLPSGAFANLSDPLGMAIVP